MKQIAVDFETFYDKTVSVKTMGPDRYVADEKFDPYMVSVYGEGIEYSGRTEDFNWDTLNGQSLLAHNARFDEAVFLAAKAKGIIPNSCYPAEWNCTADLSVFLNAPRSLRQASAALLGEEIDKTIRDDMLGHNEESLRGVGMWDDVVKYALNDSRLCYNIYDQYGDQWSDTERMVSQKNRIDSKHGVKINTELLVKGIEHLQTLMWKAAQNIPWDWSGNKTPLSPKALRAECRKAGISAPGSLAQDSQECIIWENKYGEQYPWVGAMRDWRRGNIMLKRLLTIQNRLTPDDRFPYSIKYFGGHTGRFSGDGGFNMQNMPRGENMGVDLRALFLPDPGKKMVIADLAQIEARITLWLAGDYETLAKIAEGYSIYDVHAAQTMGWDLSKGKLKEIDSRKYQLAKARVLGLGFQCGSKRFRELAQSAYGIELSEEESAELVRDFRAKNPKIVNLWQNLNTGCIRSRAGDYELELPSGRSLQYYNIRTGGNMTAALNRDGTRRVHTYGGKLTENLVQATARDVFVDKMLEIERMGVQQLFHCHDEYVLQMDEGDDTSEVLQILSETPEWLPDFPLDAELIESDRYLK